MPDNKWPTPTIEEPDMEELQEQEWNGEVQATDGCIVEVDGECPHGHPSWLVYLRIV